MIYNPDIVIKESNIGKYSIYWFEICSFITLSIELSSYSCKGFYSAIGKFCDSSYVEDNW